jgi:hypothetical protein
MTYARRVDGWYWEDGVPYPSVTAVLGHLGGRELSEWYGRVGLEEAERVRTTAAEAGTSVHALIRWTLRGSRVDLAGRPADDLVRIGYEAWFGWARAHRLRPVLTEQYLRHPVLQYAGTMDFYGWVRACGQSKCCAATEGTWRLEVVDWKTSKQLRRKDDAQPPAYGAVLRHAGYPLHGCRLLRIGNVENLGTPQEPVWQIRPVVSRDVTAQEGELLGHFVEALSLFRWLKRQPKTPPAERLQHRRPLAPVADVERLLRPSSELVTVG